MHATDFAVIFLTLSFIAIIVLMGIIIYKKRKDQTVKYYLIATILSILIFVISFVYIGTSGFNPNDPSSKKLEVSYLMDVHINDAVVTNEESDGRIYKQYAFGSNGFVDVDYEETKVLDVIFSGVEKEFVVEVLNENNYPITSEMVKVLDEGGTTFNSLDDTGVFLTVTDYGAEIGSVLIFAIVYDQELMEAMKDTADFMK
ncbi:MULTISPECIES: hypothetical protein [Aerococcus]|uniref:hypothetical protein n=1 Tax=Aerococcus TaxID=1375 RepID=UPI000DCE32CD|nr:hypothetical protein [Aerococcus urinae]RAV94325.1 hypothetical protein DBT53_05825 [Aerococcus mictus]MDK6375312.1 hypothetical protein [Aerococcus urinae]MDK6420160.1 hypothetical protein [Aerococcus urinae]MDK8075653.1 hypothetical protein [Aerococcus urinae]MDK8084578.1 hypothetical protein [Aerococcus urinae]